MRKALLAILLAATFATPVAAQESSSDETTERYQRIGERNQQRYEQREERREARQAERPSPVVEQRSAEEGAVRQQRFERQQARIGRQQVEHRAYGAVSQEAVAADADGLTERYRRLGERNQQRYERRVERDQDVGGVTAQQFGRGSEHRDLHRDYQREHRDVHDSDPTRREHRRFHRQVERDHNGYHREWDLGWRNDDRYDWQSYRYSNRGLYSPGSYYSPYRDYSYSRFGIGVTLGSGFYSRPYWINDPWRYRLPEPYPGTRWIRYYNDVLLVDTFSGEVVDVIYNFFW